MAAAPSSAAPRFTVAVPLFNKRGFIERTLRSALDQDHASFEIIVVDDGSTDGSLEAVRAIEDARLRLVEQDNAGPGPARNRAAAEARGEWIAFLDADDLWLPDHLATLDGLIERFPDADAVATDFRRRPADAAIAGGETRPAAIEGRIIDYFAEAAKREALWTSCTAVRRSAFLALGGFGDFWPGEDIDFWFKLALEHRIAASPVQTAIYTVGTGGLMDQWEARPRRAVAQQPIFATIEAALADPHHAASREAVRRYRNALIASNARQALYRGDGAETRHWLAALRRAGERPPITLRLAARMPGPAVRLASRLYSAVKVGLGRR